jgi:hypothetical protein
MGEPHVSGGMSGVTGGSFSLSLWCGIGSIGCNVSESFGLTAVLERSFAFSELTGCGGEPSDAD